MVPGATAVQLVGKEGRRDRSFEHLGPALTGGGALGRPPAKGSYLNVLEGQKRLRPPNCGDGIIADTVHGPIVATDSNCRDRGIDGPRGF